MHWLEDKTIEYIFVPKIVESIEVYCFRDNNNIKFAYLGNNIKKISPHAFSGCTNLKEVIIPRSLDIIQQYAFSDCENLKTIYYEGTEKEWKQIKKNRYWKYGSPIDIITKDGLIK